MSDIEILCTHCKKTFEIPRWVVKQIYDAIMTQAPIPQEELNLFKQLPNLKVIFDVGARTDTDYVDIVPDAQHHLFEPNIQFFSELKKKIGDRPNVFVNQFGLGARTESRGYHSGLQCFVGSWGLPDTGYKDMTLAIKNGCEYIKEMGVGQIDFLKMDTEGYELQVLLGLIHHFDKIRFIQYEHWGPHNNKCIKGLLWDDFWMEEVGYRNVLCISKSLVPLEERERLIAYIKDRRMAELA